MLTAAMILTAPPDLILVIGLPVLLLLGAAAVAVGTFVFVGRLNRR